MMSDCTIVTSGHHGSTRTTFISNNSTIWQNNSITQKTGNRKYAWLPFLLLPPSGYSILGTENYGWTDRQHEKGKDKQMALSQYFRYGWGIKRGYIWNIKSRNHPNNTNTIQQQRLFVPIYSIIFKATEV